MLPVTIRPSCSHFLNIPPGYISKILDGKSLQRATPMKAYTGTLRETPRLGVHLKEGSFMIMSGSPDHVKPLNLHNRSCMHRLPDKMAGYKNGETAEWR
jgi:hypothetical protein